MKLSQQLSISYIAELASQPNGKKYQTVCYYSKTIALRKKKSMLPSLKETCIKVAS